MLAAYTDRPRDLTHLESGGKGRCFHLVALLCLPSVPRSLQGLRLLGEEKWERQPTLDGPGQEVTTGIWPAPKAWPHLPAREARNVGERGTSLARTSVPRGSIQRLYV